MTHFARTAQKYYHREGNKIVFCNGMTLNQLATEIWDRLGYQAIDQSALSRVIHGKRLFSLFQLEKFCSILKLGKHKKDELYFALEEDYLHRHGLTIFPSNKASIDIIDIFSSQLKKIDCMRKQGLPKVAMDWADELSHQLHIYNNHERDIILKRKILNLSAETLFQKGYAAGDMLCPKDNMRICSSLVKDIVTIAKELNSPCLSTKAYILDAFAYYLLGKYSHGIQYRKFYRKSLSISRKALLVPKITDKIKLFFLRNIALNSIYLLDAEGFRKATKNIKTIVERYIHEKNFSFIFWALDTIARGQAYFDRSKALITVYESRAFSQKLRLQNRLRDAGSIRTELEILKQLKSREMIRFQKQAEKGLQIATEWGFHRYKQYFLKYFQ